MRIAVVSHTLARLGGTETYLQEVVPALGARGHDVACAFEERPASAEPMALSPDVPRWRLPSELELLRAWRPDVLYVHGLRSPRLEAALLDVAPAVLFAHSYYGTCISGSKTWSVPRPTPCARRFGAGCLLHFYPHRCGGLGPGGLVRGYRVQAARLAMLPRYRRVAVFSGHMRAEYERHGLGDRVLVLPAAAPTLPAVRAERPRDEWRLLYLGRLEPLKGIDVLVDALSCLDGRLDRPVSLAIAGQGSLRAHVERRVAALAAAGRKVAYVGWADASARARLLAESHLLVVPSLWPEPFGLVGLEAGRAGVPAVGFERGGIGEWLHDGVTGVLARDATPRALADAVTSCLASADRWERLAAGARRHALASTMERHVAALERVLEEACR